MECSKLFILWSLPVFYIASFISSGEGLINQQHLSFSCRERFLAVLCCDILSVLVSVFCLATIYSSSNWNLPSATKQSSVCVCMCVCVYETERERERYLSYILCIKFFCFYFFIKIYKSYEIHLFYFIFLIQPF